MSLSRVLEEIKKIKPKAEEKVETGSQETMTVRRGRKRAAQERLKILREHYVQELMSSAVFILVTGSEKELFSQLGVEEFKCFFADPEDFYRDLANRISPALYKGKASIANLFDVLGRHLEDKAYELNVVGYPQLIFKQQYRKTIKDKEDFVNLVKQAINEQVGGELAGLHIIRSLVDIAIKNDHASKITPILLNTDDEKLIVDLLRSLKRINPRVFLVIAGRTSKTVRSLSGSDPNVIAVRESSKVTVENTLTTISKSLKR